MFEFLKKKKEYSYTTSDEMQGLTCVFSDGSEITYDVNNNTFLWYKTAGKREDNYYNGTYECYRGQNAADYTVDKGIMSENASKSYYRRNRGRRFNCMDNTMVLVFKNEYFYSEGEKKPMVIEPGPDTPGSDGISIYYGFFDGARAEIVNVKTGNTQMFAVSGSSK